MADISVSKRVDSKISIPLTGEIKELQIVGNITQVDVVNNFAEYTTDGSVSLVNLDTETDIVITGFSNANNNGTFTIIGIDGNKITTNNSNATNEIASANFTYTYKVNALHVSYGSGGNPATATGCITYPPEGTCYTDATLQDIFFAAQPPTVTISATPAFGLRQYGDNVVNPIIHATPHLGVNSTATLTNLAYYRNASPNVNFANVSNPTDGNTYDEQDTFTVSSNQSYHVVITDSNSDTGSASGTYSFVYPFYVGWTDEDTDIFDGITRAQLLALNDVRELVKTKSNTNDTTTPTNGRFFIGYPAGYGDLSKIIDNTGFDTILDYTKYNYNVVTLDGNSTPYIFYILNFDTTQTSPFTNHYNF